MGVLDEVEGNRTRYSVRETWKGMKDCFGFENNSLCTAKSSLGYFSACKQGPECFSMLFVLSCAGTKAS
jgi:hypothetical protein